MSKSNFEGLKFRQISESVKAKTLVPIDKLGERVKEIREALGMTQKQLAKRLKVSQPVVSRIEENIESSSLKTVLKIVKALECDLMGAVVSDRTLEQIVKNRAEEVARRLLVRTQSNMAMEEQAPTKESYEYQLKKLADDLSSNPGPELWEK